MRVEGLYDRGYLVNYTEGDQALYRNMLYYIPGVSDDFHTISEDETLLSISQKYYGTQLYWYIIADANDDIVDNFDITVGTTIIIPSISTLTSMYG